MVRANISSGWFAVFASTWRIRTEQAIRDGREGPNLVVYRTNSSDPYDHHVIPNAVLRNVLTEDTLTHSTVNGSLRWNLTLKDGELHVTHRPGRIDVRDFYGAPLLVDGDETTDPPIRPIEDVDDYNSSGIVEGIANETTVISRSRSRKLRDLALRRAKGVCEACGTDFSLLFDGTAIRALQVHHKRQLALQDVPVVTGLDDLAVVCANCHAIIHADSRNALPVDVLRTEWERARVR